MSTKGREARRSGAGESGAADTTRRVVQAVPGGRGLAATGIEGGAR